MAWKKEINYNVVILEIYIFDVRFMFLDLIREIYQLLCYTYFRGGKPYF